MDAFLDTYAELVKVDDSPLYTMRYTADYDFQTFLNVGAKNNKQLATYLFSKSPNKPYGCSVFVAPNDRQQAVMGRNFDYFKGPALLLHTKPSGAYASASMVDISYIRDLPPQIRKLGLLAAPYVPIDGMNERGLSVGFMSVPNSVAGYDPQKITLTHLNAIRLMLDYASSVDEAVALLHTYNISLEHGGVHYLIGDRTGKSMLVEFIDGEMRTQSNTGRWQAATNFMICDRSKGGSGHDRYTKMAEALEGTERLCSSSAMDMLQSVAKQPIESERVSTLWSVLYNMEDGSIEIAMGANVEMVHRFQLEENDSVHEGEYHSL